MTASLQPVDVRRQHGVDAVFSLGIRLGMPSDDEERQAIGARLAAARKLAGFSLRSAAAAFKLRGYQDPPGHGTLGHWETGRNTPDAVWVRRLSKMYGVTADVLLGLIQGEAIDPAQGASEWERTDLASRPVMSTGGSKRRQQSPWNAHHHPARRAEDKKG